MSKEIAIDVGVDRIYKLISKFAPPSNPTCIERSWIMASRDDLVRINLAQRLPENRYRIRYATGRQRVQGWLIGLTSERRRGPRAAKKAGGGGSLDAFMSDGAMWG